MFQRSLQHVTNHPSAREVFEARFQRFLREMALYERRVTFEQTLDAFLDLYSAWKKTRASHMKLRLVLLACELHRLDHRFCSDSVFPEGLT